MFASGNGGGGMAIVREHTQNVSWTQEQFLKAGYAVAWLRYRAEVDYAYDKIGKLIEDKRQRRQLLNRGPLEYEDVIAIAEFLKTLPEIDGDRLGYMGMSHGGEMAFKIASEYHGIRAMIASEPAAHEFLRLKPDNTAKINPATGLLDVEKMLMRDVQKVRPRITEEVARGTHPPDHDADFRAGPQQRRAAGHLPRLLRPAGRARQGRELGDLRARRARLLLRAPQRQRRLRAGRRADPGGRRLDRVFRQAHEGGPALFFFTATSRFVSGGFFFGAAGAPFRGVEGCGSWAPSSSAAMFSMMASSTARAIAISAGLTPRTAMLFTSSASGTRCVSSRRPWA